MFARVHAPCPSVVVFWRFFGWVHQKFDVLWRHLKMMNIGGTPEQSYQVGNETECKELCLKICDCKSYQYSKMACSIWTQGLVNLQEEYVDGYNLSIRVAILDIGNVLTGRFYINCLDLLT